MSQCKIYLENYSGTYYAGADIRGRLECYFDDETSLRGIKVRIKCKEHNSWTGTETHKDPHTDKVETRHITLTGNNAVFFGEKMLYGSGSGSHSLSRGRHVYPFSFTLPYDIPSTFNGPHGSISWKIKAIVDRPMRIDYDDTFIFVVVSPIDFNQMSQDLQEITTYSDEKSLCCWCCRGGDITLDVELPKIAFVPGETIPFKVNITNLSNANVENLKVTFRKIVKYHVNSPRHESKEDEDEIISFTEHGVGAHGEFTYALELAIPRYIEPPNFTKCELFKVSYELVVCAEMPTCVLDLEVNAWDIQLGNVMCINQAHGNEIPTVPLVDPGFVFPSRDDAYPASPGGDYPLPPAGPYPPAPSGGAYPYSPGGAYPPPPGGAYPPPPGGAYPPPPGGAYPPPPGGAYAPPPLYPGPDKSPSAPSSSIASAPADDNPKAREAAGGGSTVSSNLLPELPPPSYNQVQQNSNPPYPPK